MKGKILKYSFMIAICFAFVFCFMPKQSLAASNDWIYKDGTLTNEDGVTLNVTLSNGNELTIGDNSYNSNLGSIDLTGDIRDSENNKYIITNIGDGAFWLRESLSEIKLPNSVTTIGDSVFSGCSSLTNIHISEGVTTIGDNAFEDCRLLTNIKLPNSVTTIGDSVFSGCSSLTNITLPDGVTTIGNYAFSGCSSLTNITLPDSITTIEDSAFSGCSSLTNITLPEGVTTIGVFAFIECHSLTNINIPSSVTTIGELAFSGCSNLQKVYVISETPANVGDEIFDGCSNLKGIYVPSSSIDTYKTASGWSEYASIIKGIYNKVTVENGSGSGSFVEGDIVNIKANDNDENGHFTSWKVTSGSGITLGDEKAKETTFTMVNSDVTITAVFEAHNYVDGKCSVCGYEDKNYVPPKDDNDEDNDSVSENSTVNTNNTSQTNIVKTSDNNNLIIWALMLCVCVVGIVGMIIYKKKNK